MKMTCQEIRIIATGPCIANQLRDVTRVEIGKTAKVIYVEDQSCISGNSKQIFQRIIIFANRTQLENKPSRIFNVDETGIATEHSPPKVVCSKESKPQTITSARSATNTIIVGGHATGYHIPPYYICPGKRWSDPFLNDAAPGSDGEMSVTGWSNTAMF